MLPNLTTTNKAELKNGDILNLPCDMNYYFIETDEQARTAMDTLLPLCQDPNSMVAVDIETSEFDPFVADILLLQIGTLDDRQYVFDMRKVDPNIVIPALSSPCWKVGQNLKFEGKFFKHKWGIDLTHMFDTMLAEMVIRGGSGGRKGYGLDQILAKRLDLHTTLTRRSLEGAYTSEDQEAERAKKIMQLSFTKMKPGQDFSPAQLAYAASDVSASMILQLALWQMGRLMDPGPNALFDPKSLHVTDPDVVRDYEIMFPRSLSLWDTACLEFTFLEVVIDLELQGIGFDTDLHSEVMSLIEDDYMQYRSDFLEKMSSGVKQTTLFGTAAINPDSPQQVVESLREVGIDLESSAADVVEEAFRSMEPGTKKYKIVESLMGYRKSAKLMSTYGTKLMKKLHEVSNRIHYSVQQVLDTGRISTSDPNLQNIPAKIAWKFTGDSDKDEQIMKRPGIRECFVPREGYTFLIFDYSAQEMRIAAHISQDPGLAQAFREHRDLHSHSASLMYNRDYEDLNKAAKADSEESRAEKGVSLEDHKKAKKMRDGGKTINFASLYGSGAKNISEKLHIPMDQAQGLLDRYWDAYPRLKEAIDRYGNFAVKNGYSNTVLGRRRQYTDILDKIKWVEGCPTPEALTAKVKELKLDWILESGPITRENMKKVKEKARNKFLGDIKRQAGNHHVQGTAADMTKLAAINLRRELVERGLDAFIVGIVHDEIIVECKIELSEEVSEVVERRMVSAQLHFCPTVPAEVDGGQSSHWKK